MLFRHESLSPFSLHPGDVQCRAQRSVKTTQPFSLEMTQRPEKQEPIAIAMTPFFSILINKNNLWLQCSVTDTYTEITLQCSAVPFCRTIQPQYLIDGC